MALPCARAESPEDLAYFERHIRPALVEHCYECHSKEARKLKGGLRLDHRGGWEVGGESGPEIVPGEPEQSRLIEAIRYKNPDLEMPPEGKLPAEVIARFETWVQRGAHDPRKDPGARIAAETPPVIDLEEGRRFWSFRPITNPAPPPVADRAWPRDPIDQFLLAKLEEANLKPVADANPYTLLRRLHNDLTGLPPSLEEIESFVSGYEMDPERALEAKVDTLLADPGFGQRWGRHWLDLARYSDSTGGGRAIPLPDAWRYRDYVIDSFNADRPLDQLIREHIAGDLLPHQDREERIRNLVATGFLVLGPHNYENQDKELLELEIVDEQLDTIGRAFLGMTIGCARCHDHKFDPIPTSDYYAMAGIFTSTVSVKHSNVSGWHKTPLPLTAEQEKARTESSKAIATLETEIKALKKKIGPAKPSPAETNKSKGLPGIVLDDTEAELVGEWRKSTSANSWVGAGYIHDIHEQKADKSATYRPELPKAGRYEVRFSYSASSNREVKVPVTIGHAEGETRLVVNQREVPAHDKLFRTLGTFEFKSGKSSFVRIDTKGTSGAVIADAVQFLLKGSEAAPVKPPPPAKPKPDSTKIAGLKAKLKQLENELKKVKSKAPAPATAMSVTEGNKPADDKIRIRGMPRNIGEEVPRGFLQVTQAADSSPPRISEGSGRRELAEWVASAENPLTARVLANRIWLHLFGYGLVRTPDNFGLSGEPPLHPELLDHLAHRLIDGGWSPRKLIRAIVLSHAYQLDSTPSEAALAADPSNLLLSHAHRRALDVETLRDTMLTLANELDPTAGGPSLPPGFKSEFGFKFDTLRRSVYVPVFRNTLYEFFATFDFANPNFAVGRRSMSSTPTQSLFLFNSPFVHRHAPAAAEELRKLAPANEDERIRLIFLRTLCRPPSMGETAMAREFLRDYGSEQEAWEALQRALFCSVDFRYLP